MATKFGEVLTYLEGLYTIKSYNALIMWSYKSHVTKQNHYIFTIRVPIVTTLGRMVTYLSGSLPIKSYNVLIAWSSKVM